MDQPSLAPGTHEAAQAHLEAQHRQRCEAMIRTFFEIIDKEFRDHKRQQDGVAPSYSGASR